MNQHEHPFERHSTSATMTAIWSFTISDLNFARDYRQFWVFYSVKCTFYQCNFSLWELMDVDCNNGRKKICMHDITKESFHIRLKYHACHYSLLTRLKSIHVVSILFFFSFMQWNFEDNFLERRFSFAWTSRHFKISKRNDCSFNCKIKSHRKCRKNHISNH